MAALSASSWTVTQQYLSTRMGTRKMGIFKLTCGDGSSTYPTGGIPLPTPATLGFGGSVGALQAGLDAFIVLDGTSSSGSIGDRSLFKYDSVNHKLKIYEQSIVTTATAPGAPGNMGKISNEAGADSGAFGGAAASTTYNTGAPVECVTTYAPASSNLSIIVMVIGS